MIWAILSIPYQLLVFQEGNLVIIKKLYKYLIHSSFLLKIHIFRINSTFIRVNVREPSLDATTSLISQFGNFHSDWRSYVAAYITDIHHQNQQENVDHRHQHQQLGRQHHLQLQQQSQLQPQLVQHHSRHDDPNFPFNAPPMIYPHHIPEHLSSHQNSNILPFQQQHSFVPYPDQSQLHYQPDFPPFNPAAEFQKVLSEMYPGIQHPTDHHLFQQHKQPNIDTHPTIIHPIPHQAQIPSSAIDQQLNRQNFQNSPAQRQNLQGGNKQGEAYHHNPKEGQSRPQNDQPVQTQQGQHLPMHRPHSTDTQTQLSRGVIQTGQNSVRARNRPN
jgi:hypothetical protein